MAAADDAPHVIAPLQPGAVTVLDPKTGDLLGYAFTEPMGAGQRQLWILYRHPQNSLAIAPPPANMARWTLKDWTAAVPSLWRPGSYYVRAQADLYAYGGTYDGATWSQIPEYSLPPPTYPPDEDNAQFDPCGKVIAWTSNEVNGALVYVAGELNSSSNAEYWLLLPGYAPAGASGRAVAAVGTQECADVFAFASIANRSWAPGAVLAITGCRNFHDKAGAGALPKLLA